MIIEVSEIKINRQITSLLFIKACLLNPASSNVLTILLSWERLCNHKDNQYEIYQPSIFRCPGKV